MGTQLRQWAIRLLAAAALPIMLTLSLGATANAQPTQAAHVTSSAHPSTQHDWEVYGPYYYHRDCLRAQREFEFRGHDAYCEIHYRYHHHHEHWVWYLYVRFGR